MIIHRFHRLSFSRRPSAVHRTIVVVDVEGFGARQRNNLDRVAVRNGLYRSMRQAFRNSGIEWTDCHHEDRGDGILILIPAEVPKDVFIGILPTELIQALRLHNSRHRPGERIRLRMVVHAGEVNYDRHGVVAASVNMAFRLVGADVLRAALASSRGVLAVIASSWFFDEVIRHSGVTDAATWRSARVAVKETADVAWICLPDQPFPPDRKELETVLAGGEGQAPRQLPARSGHFTGREEEMRHLTALLADTAARASEMTTVAVIHGVVGVGKTALAVYWAHELVSWFPDGQLFADLRGHAYGSQAKPHEVLGEMLASLGVATADIPVGLSARSALWRQQTAGKRMLVLLDDAASPGQVRPLLPATASCIVLITSRHRLAEMEEATPFALDTLSLPQAIGLFTRLAPVSATEPEVVGELVRRCGHLPLAIRLLAGRLRLHPSWSPIDLAARLTAANWVEEIRVGSLSLTAAFELSYRELSTCQRRLFRSLALYPDDELDEYAAATLDGVDPTQARRSLEVLYDSHLIEESAPGRYRLHVLIREYARSLAAGGQPR
jgi:hypothetical protein